MALKLNIGAGATKLDGFTPIDRKLGVEAYPLSYEDDSVDEIRSSHLLEHFSFGDAQIALTEWVRVLKPGSTIRLAVPDAEKVFEAGTTDPNWPFYLMGGQTGPDDFHRSCWTPDSLRRLMVSCGLTEIRPWESDNTDCAGLPISLNLEGIKTYAGKPSPPMVKMAAVMSIPRLGFNEAWGAINNALGVMRIPIFTYGGVFWGQRMQTGFRDCVGQGMDWILAIDYDSVFTAEHVSILCDELASRPEIDAIAAMQCRRGSPYPLMATGKTDEWMTDAPLKVASAHFGLTLIRVDALKKVPKPWFWSTPSKANSWDNDSDKMDDDIFFWHQWRLAGNSVYVSPRCRIGHLELMVAEFDDELKARHVYYTEWQKARGLLCKLGSKETGCNGKQEPSSTPSDTVAELLTPCCAAATPNELTKVEYQPCGQTLPRQDSPSAPN